ncbi:MAG: hypothetical protein RL226_2250 [Bacteroidota bacterium]
MRNKTIKDVLLQPLTLPITVISMFLVTKYWFAVPVDGPDKLFWGFPFAFIGEGFHTSMSFQIFLLELLADFIIYYLSLSILSYGISRFFRIPPAHKLLSRVIWSIALILLFGFGLLIGTSNPLFSVKRDYDWHILQTGAVVLWKTTPRPEREDFLHE